MLKYETIERLPESLFYTRTNKKPYAINAKLIGTDNNIKPSDTEYTNNYLLFKTVNKTPSDNIIKSYINVIDLTDNNNGNSSKYLEPNLDYILNKSDSLSYGDLTYVMGTENNYNSLQIAPHEAKLISSIIQIPITRNLEIKHDKKSIAVYIKEFGLGTDSAGGGVGNLEITLEVYKLTEMRFKLPTGYLTGLNTNSIAYAEGDTLVIFTREIGVVTLFTDKGTIIIRTLPGMKINKRRILGDEADIFA